jgi:hypothetical protein
MMLLRRVGDAVLLWLPVVSAILICYAVSAWSPGARPRSDETAPVLPPLSGERRGLSAEEVIERLGGETPRTAIRSSWIE